ncbi:MAG: LAGLIDADG family homing endonuclease [Candidatus Micrarchaeota archaeon]|nr:LAGLIDADG family homing endonuclease [Candidatus Micrarchaeota archaeon]
MKRLTAYQRIMIRELAKTGSLNEIYTRLSLPKSTVQYWYSDYSNYVAPKSLRFDLGSNLSVGEFMGAFAGDGNYTKDRAYKHQIRIYINRADTGYINHLKGLMFSLFGKNPSIFIDTKKNVAVLRLVSADLIAFIRTYLRWEHTKTKTVRLAPGVKRTKGFITGFLKGLMDTDGYINKKQHVAVFSTISSNLARDIGTSLRGLGIKYNCYKNIDKRPNYNPIFRVAVRQDFLKFINIIKPYHANNF